MVYTCVFVVFTICRSPTYEQGGEAAEGIRKKLTQVYTQLAGLGAAKDLIFKKEMDDVQKALEIKITASGEDNSNPASGQVSSSPASSQTVSNATVVASDAPTTTAVTAEPQSTASGITASTSAPVCDDADAVKKV